jgi:hypothetical protein
LIRSVLIGDGEFGFQIVGESHHQTAIEKMVGGRSKEGSHYRCTAIVRAEPTNRYDPNAVEVLIAGIQVGYIPAYQAADMRQTLQRYSINEAECDALVLGGWDRGGGDVGYLGVRLDLVRPFACRERAVQAPADPEIIPPGLHRMEIAIVLLLFLVVALYLMFNYGFVPLSPM